MNTQDKIKVMQAWLNGEEVEFMVDGNWTPLQKPSNIDTIEPLWNWLSFEYRIKPKPAPIPMTIPWDVIKPEYKWAAKTKYDYVFLFKEKPTVCQGGWEGFGSEGISRLLVVDKGTVGWKDSLQERPQGE